jgi:hypothetical protein
MHTRVSRQVLVMVLLTGLFGLRVAAQAVQFWIPQSFLAAFDAFQVSSLSYSTLLLTQLLIVALMLRTCLRGKKVVLQMSGCNASSVGIREAFKRKSISAGFLA